MVAKEKGVSSRIKWAYFGARHQFLKDQYLNILLYMMYEASYFIY